jgi:hypothetical protein
VSRCGQHACDSEQPVYNASWHEKSDLSIKSSCAAIESPVDAHSSCQHDSRVYKIQPEILIGFKQGDDLLASKLSCEAADVDWV